LVLVDPLPIRLSNFSFIWKLDSFSGHTRTFTFIYRYYKTKVSSSQELKFTQNILLAYFPSLRKILAFEMTFLSVCMSMSVPPSGFVPVGRFNKILQGGHAAEGDLDAIIYNPFNHS
jgi:hypothetical protein